MNSAPRYFLSLNIEEVLEDARRVRETAFANAKKALEEAFKESQEAELQKVEVMKKAFPNE